MVKFKVGAEAPGSIQEQDMQEPNIHEAQHSLAEPASAEHARPDADVATTRLRRLHLSAGTADNVATRADECAPLTPMQPRHIRLRVGTSRCSQFRVRYHSHKEPAVWAATGARTERSSWADRDQSTGKAPGPERGLRHQ